MRHPPFFQTGNQRPSGFSLVEVAIAIGIVGFALLSCVGLNAVSLTSFSEARSVDVSSRIFRSVLTQAQISDFETVKLLDKTARYYDSDGLASDGSTADVVYRAEISVGDSTIEGADFDSATVNTLVVVVYGKQTTPLSRRSAVICNRKKAN